MDMYLAGNLSCGAVPMEAIDLVVPLATVMRDASTPRPKHPIFVKIQSCIREVLRLV